MSKHTEGPWHYDKTNDAIYNKFCLYICDAPTNNKHDVELIVAAPELLETLIFARKMMIANDLLPSNMPNTFEKIDAVIAKAKGKA